MNPIDKHIEKEFYTCDKCGYSKGFHVSFVRKSEDFEVVLICPQCGQSFQVGWTTKLR